MANSKGSGWVSDFCSKRPPKLRFFNQFAPPSVSEPPPYDGDLGDLPAGTLGKLLKANPGRDVTPLPPHREVW